VNFLFCVRLRVASWRPEHDLKSHCHAAGARTAHPRIVGATTSQRLKEQRCLRCESTHSSPVHRTCPHHAILDNSTLGASFPVFAQSLHEIRSGGLEACGIITHIIIIIIMRSSSTRSFLGAVSSRSGHRKGPAMGEPRPGVSLNRSKRPGVSHETSERGR